MGGAATASRALSRPTGQALPGLLLAGTVLALWLAARGHPPPGRLLEAGILVGFAILCWASGWIAEPVTSLVFFLLTVVSGVAKPSVVFSGFASTAWWLVFGGSVTAVAVQTTGLGRRLAGLLFGRAGGSYRRAVAAVALTAVGLAFVMPSTNARVLLLLPIVLAFAEQLGLTPDRPGYTGLVLAAGVASYMPSTSILPANVPNSILLGAADTLYGVKLTYASYFLLHFPILGALKTIVLIWLVCRLFPERQPLCPVAKRDLGPMSPKERRLAVLLVLSLLFFATDFLHGISPGWVSLGTGILCLLPSTGILSAKAFSERVNVVTLIYIAGILGLGAVVADSGLSEVASAGLLRLAPLTPGHPAGNTAILSAVGAGLSMITTVTGAPAVLTPLAREFAAASGLPLLSVLMLQVVSFSTVLLPFQSPPIMIALQMGGVSVRAGAKLCLALAAVTIIALLPLDYFW
jgi:anion transporter